MCFLEVLCHIKRFALLFSLDQQNVWHDVSVPSWDDHAGQADGEQQLGPLRWQEIYGFRGLGNSNVEGLLPSHADQNADGIDDGADGLIDSVIHVLEVLNHLQAENHHHREDSDAQGLGHLLSHALLLAEQPSRQAPVGPVKQAPSKRHRNDVFELASESRNRMLNVYHAEYLDGRQDNTNKNQEARLPCCVVCLDGVRLVALVIRKVATNSESHTLHKTERHREPNDVVFGLLCLVVPHGLVLLLFVIADQGNALPDRVGKSASDKDHDPRQERKCQRLQCGVSNLVLQHREGMNRREARDVAKQDRECLQPGFHHLQVVESRIKALDGHHTCDNGKEELQGDKPCQHVGKDDDQLCGLGSAFQDVGLHEAVHTLKDQHR
mmetsp:Transcript_72481/g.209827  ORF Transcript_72481/g.209827 Transcript_72481/m.209827 type:complete len:381 (-) Transcript_72481:327-1469(-)